MPTIINGNTGIDRIQDGVIQQADLPTALLPLGVGQTWQSVLGSRALDTQYTNGTGRTIAVSVSAGLTTSQTLTAVVGGVTVQIQQGGNTSATQNSVSFEVPSGATYRVNSAGGPTASVWAELI